MTETFEKLSNISRQWKFLSSCRLTWRSVKYVEQASVEIITRILIYELCGAVESDDNDGVAKYEKNLLCQWSKAVLLLPALLRSHLNRQFVDGVLWRMKSDSRAAIMSSKERKQQQQHRRTKFRDGEIKKKGRKRRGERTWIVVSCLRPGSS